MSEQGTVKEQDIRQKRFRTWLRNTFLRSLLVVFLVMLAVFFMIRLVPGDPAVMVLGEHATEESIETLREQLGVNLPLSQQFLRFLSNIFLHGDTGTSLK